MKPPGSDRDQFQAKREGEFELFSTLLKPHTHKQVFFDNFLRRMLFARVDDK